MIKAEEKQELKLSDYSAFLFAKGYVLGCTLFAKRQPSPHRLERLQGWAPDPLKDAIFFPLDSFVIDASAPDATLKESLAYLKASHGLQRVFVPPDELVDDQRRDNQLFNMVPSQFNPVVMRTAPEPLTSLLSRAQGLKEGRLDETLFPDAERLEEEIRQTGADEKPQAELSSYLLGVYELLREHPDLKPKRQRIKPMWNI